MTEVQTEPVLPETEAPAETESETEKDDTLYEEAIYTFLQGPRAFFFYTRSHKSLQDSWFYIQSVLMTLVVFLQPTYLP